MYLVTQSCLTLCDPWTVACQAPLTREFFRQEYWSGLPCLSPGDLPKPGIEPSYPTLQVFKTSKSIKCPYWENGDILSSNHCWCPAHNSSAFFFFSPGYLHMHVHSFFSVSVWCSLARGVCLAHTQGRALLSNSQLPGANLNQ